MEREDIRTTEKQPLTDILAKTVKTGIIKSNLVPMFAGLTLALYTYEYGLLEKLPEIIFALIGSIMVMGAAGAFNNWYDRDIDAIMERTKTRPTVTGQIKPRQVLWLASLMAVLGVIILSLATPLAGFLGFLGLFLCRAIHYVDEAKNHLQYGSWKFVRSNTAFNWLGGHLSGHYTPGNFRTFRHRTYLADAALLLYSH